MTHVRRAPSRVFALASFALVSSTRIVFAQVPPPAPQAPADATAFDRARREFESGVHLLEDARYADAASALERSLALRESPAVRYNLGLALRGTGAYRRAIASLEHFLAQPGSASREQQRSAGTMVREMRAALVHVTVDVTGVASQLLVDGESVLPANGRHALELDPGAHVFEARRTGYQPVHSERRIDPGTSAAITLDASLHPMLATLIVETSNARATVRVDDGAAVRGQYNGQLAAGSHTVEVVAEGLAVQRRTLQLAPGARLVVSINARAPTVVDRWWFWTGVGVLTAGAATGIGIAAGSHTAPPVRGTLDTIQAITAGASER